MYGYGITSYAAYIPRARLARAELRSALGTGDGPGGARAVASFDEDTTTMAVEAARLALSNSAAPDSLFFATTVPAYVDKTNASAIHAALDLGREGFAVDMAGSARSSVGAIRAAASAGGLALLSDIRTGRPGSADEADGGDGAAAFLFGDPSEAVAEIVAEASVTAEFLDRWRQPGDYASSQWEERFGLEAYMPLVEDAAARALAAAGLERADHVIVSSPHRRTAVAASRRFEGRISEDQIEIGYAGAADPGVRLAAVLDRANAGESILVLIAADGCDATVLRTTERLERNRATRSVAEQASAGRSVRYATYLTWRGLIEREPPRRPEPERPAGPASARSEGWKFAFVGTRCEECGQIHVPPRRVCVGCGTVDRMAKAPLADKRGAVVTYTVDHLAFSPSPPMIDAVVDFDDGGRYTLEVTDAEPEEVRIGALLELTFRRLYTAGGVHNYFWKARPVANGAGGVGGA